jgi:putative DNA primase/helicase
MSETPKDAAKRLAAPILNKGFKPQALHTYRDAQGNPLYWRIRAKHPETGEKWIRPMHLNGKGFQLGEPKWEGPKPIYNLDRIARAAPDAPVFIVEGEWAADHLTRLGILNTTSGGADSADRADWTPLQGRECVTWRDLDEPGRMYAEEVSAKLHALQCPVSHLDVEALGLTPKGDAVDWIAANPKATAAEVLSLPRVEARRATHDAPPLSSPIPASSAAPGSATDRVELIRADGIEPEAINWLWNGYLATGKVHIVAGAPGTGKTTLAIGFIGTVTSGGRWPDSTRARVGSALIWSGEDSAADTLLPRLIASGANLEKVHFVGDLQTINGARPFDPAEDFATLEAEAARIPDLRFVLVDPIVSAIAGDGHKGNDVRRGLQPLVHFAQRTGCAVVGISHFSKGTAGRDPVERVTGSVAFGALARVVLATAKMRDEDGGGRIMVRAKSNIGLDGGGFRYDLRQVELQGRHAGIVATRPEWTGTLEGAARELLAAVETDSDPEERSATDEASERLRELLEEGGSIETQAARRQLKADGFTDKQIRRARESLGVVRKREGYGGKDYWRLPDSPRSCPVRDVHAQPLKEGTNGHERDCEGMNGAESELL